MLAKMPVTTPANFLPAKLPVILLAKMLVTTLTKFLRRIKGLVIHGKFLLTRRRVRVKRCPAEKDGIRDERCKEARVGGAELLLRLGHKETIKRFVNFTSALPCSYAHGTFNIVTVGRLGSFSKNGCIAISGSTSSGSTCPCKALGPQQRMPLGRNRRGALAWPSPVGLEGLGTKSARQA